jgi:hypothetical protein
MCVGWLDSRAVNVALKAFPLLHGVKTEGKVCAAAVVELSYS